MLISVASPRPAAAQASSGPYLGEIEMFAFNFCPNGWALAAGQLLSISQNEALFNLIGTEYGGDGVNTFALPKWGPVVTANGQPLTVCIALTGVFPAQT
jgi:microcystin-dependent protein